MAAAVTAERITGTKPTTVYSTIITSIAKITPAIGVLNAADIAAAEKTWSVAKAHLTDARYDLVVLDELTYMLAYDYLPEDEIIDTLTKRPENQSVIVTGRGGGSRLADVMDTVSEVKDIKHAYNSGIKARKGVDF